MSSNYEHITTEIRVDEEAQNLFETSKAFYSNHKEAIAVVGIIVATLMVNRWMLRRELKSLTFSAEFFPYDMFDEEYMTPATVAG